MCPGARRQFPPSPAVSCPLPETCGHNLHVAESTLDRFSLQVRRTSGEGRLFFLCSSDRLPFSRVPEPREGRPVGVAPARDGLTGAGA